LTPWYSFFGGRSRDSPEVAVFDAVRVAFEGSSILSGQL
jgi:hypothetical protein